MDDEYLRRAFTRWGWRGVVVLAFIVVMAVGSLLVGTKGEERRVQGVVVSVDHSLRVVRADVRLDDGSRVTGEVDGIGSVSAGDRVTVALGERDALIEVHPFLTAVVARAVLVAVAGLTVGCFVLRRRLS